MTTPHSPCLHGLGGGSTYCHRNTVERGFNRLKQWRGVATRYALTYLGGVTLAAIIIHHHVRN